MMGSIQSYLKVPLRIPIMLQEDDCVSRGQQHDLYGGVAVETLHQGKAL